ncbi:uncharacterized protein LOC116613854 [Nematostella vectensis]|uniref:uncharacterized protein LOC116613854 n=1 Tax=Nematostella vectensis TaxID=45351 RepID=UPI0020775C8B|nr:uncharacterized protein LOC116613854 [Nematostella vectensis]
MKYWFAWIIVAFLFWNVELVGQDGGKTELWFRWTCVSRYVLYFVKRLAKIVCWTLYFLALNKYIKYTQGWWLQWRIANKPGYDPRAALMGGSRRLMPESEFYTHPKSDSTMFVPVHSTPSATASPPAGSITMTTYLHFWITVIRLPCPEIFNHSGFSSRAHALCTSLVRFGMVPTSDVITFVAIDNDCCLFEGETFWTFGTRLLTLVVRTEGARICFFSTGAKEKSAKQKTPFKVLPGSTFTLNRFIENKKRCDSISEVVPGMDLTKRVHDKVECFEDMCDVPRRDYITPVLCCGGAALGMYIIYRFFRR